MGGEREGGEAERNWRGTAVGEGDGGFEDVVVAPCFTRIFAFDLSITQPRPNLSKSLARRHFSSVTRL